MIESLHPGCFYHIYNRGNNRDKLFLENRNYYYFLDCYIKYIRPIAGTFAYCLLPNHFHFLIRIRETWQDLETCQALNISKQFSNFFNAYAKAINKQYQRTGSLFQKPFRRKCIKSQEQLTQTLLYIHFNPVNHGFVKDPIEWPYSSFIDFYADRKSFILKTEVLSWFQNKTTFIKVHKAYAEEIVFKLESIWETPNQ